MILKAVERIKSISTRWNCKLDTSVAFRLSPTISRDLRSLITFSGGLWTTSTSVARRSAHKLPVGLDSRVGDDYNLPREGKLRANLKYRGAIAFTFHFSQSRVQVSKCLMVSS